MNINIYQVPDKSESLYRGIGFYTDNLVRALKKQTKSVNYFSKETKINKSNKNTLAHYPWLHPYFLTIPLKKIYPRIITIHDLIPVKFPRLFPAGYRARIIWQVNKQIIKNADAIITDSLTSKNDILRFVWPIDARKVSVVPLAADSVFQPLKNPVFPNSLTVSQSHSLSKHFVLYVGDINPSKNLPMLCRVCIKLKIPLVLVGKKLIQNNYDKSHPENQDLVSVQKMIKNNSQLIFALGYIKSKDLVNLYNLATAYCQPSLEEGFGLSVLEAMQCGCPVAVSQTSSLVEITKANAFLFDPNSQASLEKSLSDAINNDKIRAINITAGIKRAKQYSWSKTAINTLGLYKSIID